MAKRAVASKCIVVIVSSKSVCSKGSVAIVVEGIGIGVSVIVVVIEGIVDVGTKDINRRIAVAGVVGKGIIVVIAVGVEKVASVVVSS